MKKIFSSILVLVVAALLLSSCTTNSTLLRENHTAVEKTVISQIAPDVEVWVDRSTSLNATDYSTIKGAAEAKAKETGATVNYFAGASHGAGTLDGWTDLSDIFKVSRTNRAILWIYTDGRQELFTGSDGTEWIYPASGLDIHYVCIRKGMDSESLHKILQHNEKSFQKSSVSVEYLDGNSAEIIIDEFAPLTAEGVVQDDDTLYELYLPWWVWLFPLLGLLGLWGLLGLLRTRKSEDEPEEESEKEPKEDTEANKSTPEYEPYRKNDCGKTGDYIAKLPEEDKGNFTDDPDTNNQALNSVPNDDGNVIVTVNAPRGVKVIVNVNICD